MRPYLAKLLLAALLAAGSARADTARAENVGVRELAVPQPARGAAIRAMAWYPAEAGGTPVVVGDNGVFRGMAALQDAPVAAGRHRLVVIAFGGFRVAPDMASWLAASLAGRGFVAVVVNPPPLPPGPARQSVLDEVWLRPADLSATITALARQPAFAVDLNDVGAVGFFLGGDAVLALAGARINPAAFARSCDDATRGPDCQWFAAGGADPHRVDAGRVGRSHADRRVTSVVAVDPELMALLAGESLPAMAAPVLIVTTRAEGAQWAIARAKHTQIADAGPFSAFPECKPRGPEIVAREGGEVRVCEDAGQTARSDSHTALALLIAHAMGPPDMPQK